MENTTNLPTIEKHLQKIAKDELFVHSARQFELLKFLVEQSHQGHELKETTIGQRFFGEDYAHKREGSVRVYAYNLRKKLKLYYDTRGAQDDLVFSLEKGRYLVKFEYRNQPSASIPSGVQRHPHPRWKWIIASTLTLALTSGIASTLLRTDPIFCWQVFWDSSKPTLCVLSDQIMIAQQQDGHQVSYVHPEVNNDVLYRNQALGNLEIRDYTLFSKVVPFALHDLTRWFTQHESDFSLALESELDYMDVKRSNIIYIGQLHNMGISRENLLKGSRSFRATSQGFSYMKAGQQTLYASHAQTSTLSYVLVSYVALSEDHHALYFVSDDDEATRVAVRDFTHAHRLEQLYEDLPKDAYFHALFEINTSNQQASFSRLIALEQL